MSWEELAVTQQVAGGRDLVTYCPGFWLFSNSPDGPFAIGARARRLPNRGSDRGWLVCLTSGDGSRPYGRRDTPVWYRTADAIGSARWDRRTLCNADTHIDTTWPPAMVNNHQTDRQTPERRTGPWTGTRRKGRREENLSVNLFEEDGHGRKRRILRREIQTKSSARITRLPAHPCHPCHPR